MVSKCQAETVHNDGNTTAEPQEALGTDYPRKGHHPFTRRGSTLERSDWKMMLILPNKAARSFLYMLGIHVSTHLSVGKGRRRLLRESGWPASSRDLPVFTSPACRITGLHYHALYVDAEG